MSWMSRINRPAARATAAAAVAALAAGGLYAFASAPAQAADATVLRIDAVYPQDSSGSAGTCMIYRAVATTASGEAPSDSGSIVITLTENDGQDNTQDVDFCTPPTLPDSGNGNRITYAKYKNGQPNTSGNPLFGTEQCYYPGESVTPPAAATPAGGGCADNNPDTASNAQRGPTTPTYSGDDSNPTGVDYMNDKRVEYNANKQFVEFGVVGHIKGQATIDAYIDRNQDQSYSASDGDIKAQQVVAAFTKGGDPDTIQASDAVSELRTDRDAFVAVKSPFTQANIDLTLLNDTADTVFGVRPTYRVQSGPNASSTNTACNRSDDFGRSTCSYIGQNLGTDTLLIWVNQSAKPGAVATPGPDAGEPTKTVTVTTYAQPGPSASARFIDLTPNTPITTTAGESRVFTATVTDASGGPVQGTQVTFDETGPGQIQGGVTGDGINSSLVVSSGPDGRATVTIVTRPGETGQETVTARISNIDTECGRLVNGSTGTCSDSTTNTVAAPGPKPSASPTGSPRPSPSASATPTASVSPSSSPPAGCRVPTLRINTPTINATGLASVSVSGAAPNSRVELQGYSQNHYGTASFDNDTTNPDRVGTADSGGAVTFNDLRPASNTRLRARMAGCPTYSASGVINVRAQETLQVTRTGTRSYTFSGRSIPARPGGLIISLYRIVGTACAAGVEPRSCPGEVFVGQARAVALGQPNEGLYSIKITFPAKDQNVRDEFVVKTGQDAQNAPGRSNARSLLIY